MLHGQTSPSRRKTLAFTIGLLVVTSLGWPAEARTSASAGTRASTAAAFGAQVRAIDHRNAPAGQPYVPSAVGARAKPTNSHVVRGAQWPSLSRRASHLAVGGLEVSLAALMIGALGLRRRLVANVVKFSAMALMIVSLAVLVAACGSSPPDTFGVEVAVSGLPTGSTVILTDVDRSPSVPITIGNTSGVAVDLPLSAGTMYSIQISSPSGELCVFTGSQPPSGTIEADLTLFVSCSATTGYSVSVSVTGLTAGSLTVNPGGSSSVTVPANSTASVVVDSGLSGGGAYSLSFAQPTGATCAFANASSSSPTMIGGTISATTPANVTQPITCTETDYPVNITVAGLASGTMVSIMDSLGNRTSTSLGNGLTAFENEAYGTGYSLTLGSPMNQSCTFTSGAASGTILGTVSLTVTCSPITIPTYTVSVTVTGLATATSFTVTDPAHNTAGVTVSANGTTYTLDTGLQTAATYDATFTSPSGQTCNFSNSSTTIMGTIGSANVTLPITCMSSTTPISLNGPNGMVFDASSANLYVANSGGSEVLRYTVSNLGAGTTTLTQNGSITAGISNPSRLALDAAGYLYVANYSSNTVTVYNPANSLSTIVTTMPATTGISHPLGLAVDQSGNVYVGNNSSNQILVFSGSPASGFTLSATLSHDGAGNQFSAPGALMFNTFAGQYNGLLVGLGPGGSANLVLLYQAPLTTTSTPTGTLTNSSCSTGPSGPTGIAVKNNSFPAQANIFVTSYYNNNVTGYGLQSMMNTSNGCPAPSFNPSGSTSLIAQPEGIAVDAFGNVFVANSGNSTITGYSSIANSPYLILH